METGTTHSVLDHKRTISTMMVHGRQHDGTTLIKNALRFIGRLKIRLGRIECPKFVCRIEYAHAAATIDHNR